MLQKFELLVTTHGLRLILELPVEQDHVRFDVCLNIASRKALDLTSHTDTATLLRIPQVLAQLGICLESSSNYCPLHHKVRWMYTPIYVE